MALARCGIVGVARPNVIWLDSDFKCRQVDLSRRLGGKLTSSDVEKKSTWSRLQSDLDNKWRNTNWRKKSCYIQYVVWGLRPRGRGVSVLPVNANVNGEVVCVGRGMARALGVWKWTVDMTR